MGTRSTIAIQNADGTVTGIYCNWDGYTQHNGVILCTHYNTENRVRELLDLGDLSSLRPKIGEKHPLSRLEMSDGEIWLEEWNDWCAVYGRDGGETDTQAETCANWETFLENNSQEFNYLFVPNRGWYVQYWNEPVQHLTLAMLAA